MGPFIWVSERGGQGCETEMLISQFMNALFLPVVSFGFLKRGAVLCRRTLLMFLFACAVRRYHFLRRRWSIHQLGFFPCLQR